jgi:hypothetical protein
MGTQVAQTAGVPANGWDIRRVVSHALLVVVAAPLVAAGQAPPLPSPPPVAFVRVESPAKRLRYLASAQIWEEPGDLTPEALLAGPPLRDGSGVAGALDGRPFPCTFAEPGRTMGGNTLKFMCTTATGQMIRVKYTDGSRNGNREVFSAVAASRLLWALGFHSDPVYPITLDCRDCPSDPRSGLGSIARRSYLAIYQPQAGEPVLVDASKSDQGWRWQELDRAIDTLPAGQLRSRQRQHFDALMLLGVFLQHGDRKPEQQRLACRSGLNLEAGDLRPPNNKPGSLAVLFERPGTMACETPEVSVQDIGATFGGAGRRTSGVTAKMNLKAWAARPVFHPAPAKAQGPAAECRGQLIVSMAAGEGSLEHPRIGEAGRLFLLERLHRMTEAHLRAIFTAARIEQMTEAHEWRDPGSQSVYTATDAWVAAFQDKVRQIEARTCAP